MAKCIQLSRLNHHIGADYPLMKNGITDKLIVLGIIDITVPGSHLHKTHLLIFLKLKKMCFLFLFLFFCFLVLFLFFFSFVLICSLGLPSLFQIMCRFFFKPFQVGQSFYVLNDSCFWTYHQPVKWYQLFFPSGGLAGRTRIAHEPHAARGPQVTRPYFEGSYFSSKICVNNNQPRELIVKFKFNR